MANSLINAASAADDPAAPKEPATVLPTWGYHATEAAKIFDLKPGEKLPAGWSDHPLAEGEKVSKAAETVSAPEKPDPGHGHGKRHK